MDSRHTLVAAERFCIPSLQKGGGPQSERATAFIFSKVFSARLARKLMSIDANHGITQFWIEPIEKCLPYSRAPVSWSLLGEQLKAVEVPEHPERFARCQTAISAVREHGRQMG